MSDSSRIAAQVSIIPPKQLPEPTQAQSWFTVVKNAFNPTALLFGAPSKQLEALEPLSPMVPTLIEPDDLLCQKVQDTFWDTIPLDPPIEKGNLLEEPTPPKPSLHIPTPTTTPASLIAEGLKQEAAPQPCLYIPTLPTTSSRPIAEFPEQEAGPLKNAAPEPSLHIPTLTATPARLIAAIPEEEAHVPEEPVPPQQSLHIPTQNTTPAVELADIAEEDPDTHKAAPSEIAAPPLAQASTTLDTAARVATKASAVATVTGTLAKGVDLLPGGAGVKQKAMGKIHALYQGIKFPSLSLRKVYQGTKALYQMASCIKSSELIGAAIVCGGLYWWFKRPPRSHQSSSRQQAHVINVNVVVQGGPPAKINNTVNAPIHVHSPVNTDKSGDVK